MVDGFPSELHCCLCPFGSNWMDLGSGSASQLSLWTLFSWVISIFFLDTVQPFPKKQVMGFFIPPSHIRKADLKTYTPGSAGGRDLLQAVCQGLCPGSSIYCLYDYLAHLPSDYVHHLQYLKIWEGVKRYKKFNGIDFHIPNLYLHILFQNWSDCEGTSFLWGLFVFLS